MKSKTIKVDYLARVEGEGGMLVKVSGNKVTDVKFNIFEPPRFFEAFLRGRHYSEAPDITARICGICPVAYQMSSVHAMENAFGVIVDSTIFLADPICILASKVANLVILLDVDHILFCSGNLCLQELCKISEDIREPPHDLAYSSSPCTVEFDGSSLAKYILWS